MTWWSAQYDCTPTDADGTTEPADDAGGGHECLINLICSRGVGIWPG